jgi:hypothetical protein
VYGVAVRPGEHLCREVFPANVLLPDGALWRTVACYITNERLVVFFTDSFGMIVPRLIADLLEPVTPSMNSLMGSQRIEVKIAGGTVWVNRDRGCGCGSPLKTMGSPWSWTAAA